MATLELETVQFGATEHIARITLNRPDALNAWTPQLGLELIAALKHAEAETDVRAVIIAGAGRAFSSGADLRSGEPRPKAQSADVLTNLREVYNPLILRVRTIPKPVISAVNGVAAGIGFSLAIAADFVVASESAYFLMAFANVGLTLDGGASPLLVGRVGHARASEIALLADRVPAATALEWGLINRVVPADHLESVTTALATKLASGAPASYAAMKRTLNAAAYPTLAELLDMEAVAQQQCAETADFLEGMSAFLQKRPPRFTGH